MTPPEDRDAALARYREGPALLEQAVAGLPDDDLDARPAQGGWTIRQIVHHVVDGDDIWKMGLKMALGNERAEFALDWYGQLPQETWAERWAYSRRPLDVSLALFRAIRAHVLQILAGVPEGWERSLAVRTRDGKVERVTVGAIVQMQSDHVPHHVKRIRAIRKEISGG